MPELKIDLPMVDCALGFYIGHHMNSDGLDTITIRSSGAFRLTPREPQELKWFLQQASKVTTLLAITAGSPMAPDAIRGDVVGGERDVALLIALRDGALCKHKNANDFFMTRPDMGASLGVVMQSWFASCEPIHLPTQLALSVFSSEGLWSHVEFLSLMQALEGLHRATHGGKYVSDVDYEPIRDALSNAIPREVEPDHRAALKAKLKYGNEYSLQKRLTELQKKLDPTVAARLLKGGTVPSTWVRTRNYFTHWDEASRVGVLEGYEMYAAMVRMRAMLRALLLSHAAILPSAFLSAVGGFSNIAQELVQLHD